MAKKANAGIVWSVVTYASWTLISFVLPVQCDISNFRNGVIKRPESINNGLSLHLSKQDGTEHFHTRDLQVNSKKDISLYLTGDDDINCFVRSFYNALLKNDNNLLPSTFKMTGNDYSKIVGNILFPALIQNKVQNPRCELAKVTSALADQAEVDLYLYVLMYAKSFAQVYKAYHQLDAKNCEEQGIKAQLSIRLLQEATRKTIDPKSFESYVSALVQNAFILFSSLKLPVSIASVALTNNWKKNFAEIKRKQLQGTCEHLPGKLTGDSTTDDFVVSFYIGFCKNKKNTLFHSFRTTGQRLGLSLNTALEPYLQYFQVTGAAKVLENAGGSLNALRDIDLKRFTFEYAKSIVQLFKIRGMLNTKNSKQQGQRAQSIIQVLKDKGSTEEIDSYMKGFVEGSFRIFDLLGISESQGSLQLSELWSSNFDKPESSELTVKKKACVRVPGDMNGEISISTKDPNPGI